VIPSVRKQHNSSKVAAVVVDIASPRLRLICGEFVVATDAMVEQAILHHALCYVYGMMVCRLLLTRMYSDLKCLR
jgi:hypothetical protein